MKKITILVYLSLFLPLSVLSAQPIDTDERAAAVLLEMQNTFMSLPGVIGTGLPSCDPVTGGPSQAGHASVHCIGLYIDTKVAYQVLLQLYPEGTQVNGVFIRLMYTDHVGAQPRLSVGTQSCAESLILPPLLKLPGEE